MHVVKRLKLRYIYMKQDYAFINQYPKEDVYNLYCAAVLGGKDYDRITRKQMLIEIYAEIVYNPEWLEGDMSKDLLTYLLDIQKHGIDLKSINQEQAFMLQRLEGLYVIYYDKQSRAYVIPNILKDALNLYIPTNLHDLLDEFYGFIHGLLMTRGFMSKKE